ncbi:MAG: hypothetical protein K8R92_07175 [Planctomycetes bacterium]|nr:hypothetical protein [Planctomycetota bacterium]
MQRSTDNTRRQIFSTTAFHTAVYAAAIVAGYATGIALLLWRADTGSNLQYAIDGGVVGVEQLNPARYWFWGHTGVRDTSGSSGIYRGTYWPDESWNPPAWFVLCAGMWLAVLMSRECLCLASTRIAPRPIRLAASGSEGALVKEIWKKILRESTASLGSPFVLGVAFLVGLAIVILGDVAILLSRTEPGYWFFEGFMPLPIEIPPLLCMAIVVPIVLVRTVAVRRVRLDTNVIQRWCSRCGRCGHSLNSKSTELPEAVRCPECGHCSSTYSSRRRTYSRSFQATIATVLLGVFALLIATPRWTREFSLLFLGVFNPGAAELHVDRVIVKAGGFVRVERPDGIIWFRVDRLGPQVVRNWGGDDPQPYPDTRLRVVTEMGVASMAGGNGVVADRRMNQRQFSMIVYDTNKPSSYGNAGITLADDGKGNTVEMQPVWNPDWDYVIIEIAPKGATSIQAVDPATAPSFEDDK